MAPAVRIAEWAPQLRPDAGEHPRVSAWLDALRARPSVAAIDAKGERVEG
jgi:glutathione S-transferase